ncbi:GtrA family protein (plasmid) [Pantoea sp. JZ2]|uniref:GtrA family protein n=1 Tax=Pantoea sp. JZ2 TaxID=2654189 RepID=UPI002B492951|nr:GtrA family protein [Pantoea sp. JZ2]WRH12442.1 GtrA family protein [Pantoea sp. JZ2]WRH15969.1 GtrA family protein [Pantoea sp. JZ2]
MLEKFSKYFSVGIINTALHWAAFYVLYGQSGNQSISNFIAFCLAVTFSFFANAKVTFKSKVSTSKYFLYIGFMGAMAASIGSMSDKLNLNPIITLILFSVISLFMGFFYSKFIVFRDEK